MSRVCLACTHPDREGIDRALLAKTPLRALAGQYGISRAALHRHAHKCIGEAVKALHQKPDAAEHGSSVLAQARRLVQEARQIQQAAMAADDPKTALGAIHSQVRVLELLAKLLGEVDAQPTVNISAENILVALSPEQRAHRLTLAARAVERLSNPRSPANQSLPEIEGETR